MTSSAARIDSSSVGDPDRFLTLGDLERQLETFATPRERGTVALVVRRTEGGRREILERASLAADAGIPGDLWERRQPVKPDAALAVMQIDVARLIANQQPIPLFGDNLYVDLDLSVDNLPTGSTLRIGDAVVRVTAEPHNGCHKFKSRFGTEALRFVCMKELRHRNLRGIYMRVVSGGEVTAGGPIEVLSRA